MLTVNKKDLATNALMARQYAEIGDFRFNANARNSAMASGLTGMAANAAQMDPRLWTEVDSQTRQLMLPSGGVSRLLTDLQPLARSVNIGVLATMYRRAAGDFEAQTSLDGQHRKPMDKGTYDYDGTLVLVHTSQFGIQWRELEGQRRVGFDQIADDQANAVRAVRRQIVRTFLDGSDIVYKGVGAAGIRNSTNVQAVDLDTGPLAFDFTDTSEPFDSVRAALAALVDVLHGDNNGAEGDVTLYVSSAVWSNFQRTGVTAGNIQTFGQVLAAMPGVDKIERLPELQGNEIIGIIRQAEYIRPVVGMPVNTVPMERVTPMDDYQFLTWTATGLEIRSDAEGRSGVLYAVGS